jgi:hypothetical protein
MLESEIKISFNDKSCVLIKHKSYHIQTVTDKQKIIGLFWKLFITLNMLNNFERVEQHFPVLANPSDLSQAL